MPTSVAAITLAKPAATGGRASHDQNAASESSHAGRAARGGEARSAERASARIARRSASGGAALASGACSKAWRSQASCSSCSSGEDVGRRWLAHEGPPCCSGSRYAPMHVRSLLIA